MTTHSDNPSTDKLEQGNASLSPRADESNTRHRPRLSRRLFYWWSLFVAGALLLIIGPPSILLAWLARRRHWLYPFALFGARTWLKLSGVRVRVRGLEQLNERQTYVFISNHRSYLDTATLFYYTGRRIGLLAKKELLKVPILGYGMGYCNIMAIDRRSRESALRTVRAATERIHSGISFGVFAEGTRARPGQLLPFKKGAFYMAMEAGVPIVPVAMKNTDALMGKGTGEARPGTIEMVLLPPVETAGLSTDEDVKRLIQQVHDSIAEELGKGLGVGG
ncbi:MAG: 1-acyl-sn-glycerol-3-phosphate acyltransferase [Blastocatellia bacterium]|jgi:1-acyl-sn-glycerol-3-phosphate acyltransferase|nr:1-acyl-sn-glycerol-3-phosphate acyltransferase [Blastocatellia bacterium]